MEYTNKLNLKKPGYGDSADIVVVNDNMDIIDVAVGARMPIAGDTFTGISKAHPNTSYTVAQLRNVILSTGDAVVGSMSDGDIWIKYK